MELPETPEKRREFFKVSFDDPYLGTKAFWTPTQPETWTSDRWTYSEPNLLAYVMVAATAVFLVGWGVRTSSKALVNYGMAGFAITVVWFYFSSVMDKLGRSLGLIVLGVLFLAGGWALEHTRRRLVSGMAGGPHEA